MEKLKYMTLAAWKKREFVRGSAWDNRTIKKLVEAGIIKGITLPHNTVIREDQTLSQLEPANCDSVTLEQLFAESVANG